MASAAEPSATPWMAANDGAKEGLTDVLYRSDSSFSFAIDRALRRFADVAFCVGIALLMIVFSVWPVSVWLTALPGSLLVFVVPGYALTLVLWSRELSLAVGDRVILSVGLSAALTVFSVLLLSVTGVGVTAFNIVLALSIESLVMSLTAARLRQIHLQGVPQELIVAVHQIRAGFRSDKPFWTVASALLLAGAVLVAMIVSIPSPPLTTQLFVLGPDGTISTLPRVVVANQSSHLIVGVHNGDSDSIGFRVTICLVPANGTCAGQPAVFANWNSSLAFDPNDAYELNLSVARGQSVENPLTFTSTVPGMYTMTLSLDGGHNLPPARFPLRVTG